MNHAIKLAASKLLRVLTQCGLNERADQILCCNALKNMVPPIGFEPTTPALRIMHKSSKTLLLSHSCIICCIVQIRKIPYFQYVGRVYPIIFYVKLQADKSQRQFS